MATDDTATAFWLARPGRAELRREDLPARGAGDVLVEIAGRLRSNLRAVDLLARIGGEEFLVALPDTTRAAFKRFRISPPSVVP